MGGKIAVALLLSALAGLSTTVGSFAAIFVHKPGARNRRAQPWLPSSCFPS